MKRDEIVAGLRWLRPESGDFACEGCGWENSCGVHGCRIMREAADMLDSADAIGLLRDWADSPGAKCEMALAQYLDKRIIHVDMIQGPVRREKEQ